MSKYSEKEVPLWDRYLLAVKEASLLSGLSEHTIKKEIEKGTCPFAISIGSSAKKKMIKRTFQSVAQGTEKTVEEYIQYI